MGKKLLTLILGVLVGSLITSPMFSFAQEETASDKPEAHCDAYESDENKLSEENKKVVIVIGAGISGLSAAHHLYCKGYDITVLEALDRTGGRINTNNSTGIPLDLGASWIHGIEESPIFKIFTDADKRGDIIITNQDSAVAYDANGENADKKVEEFWDKIDKTFTELYEKRKTSASDNDSFELVVNEYLETYVDTGEVEKENFYYYLYWQYVLDDAANPKDVSLKYRDEFAEYPSVEVVFRNGYGQVIDYLDDGLDVLTEHVVTEINYNGQKVIVSFKNALGEQTLEADYVVSTIPLGVLKGKTETKVIFSPDITTERQDALDHLDMGVYNKVYYIFNATEQPFWIVDKDKDWISLIPEKGEEMGQGGIFFNFYKYTGKPILLEFNTGDYSRQLNEKAAAYSQEKKEQDEYIAGKGLEILEKMYPNKVPPLSDVTTLVTTWEREPYFGGSFSYFPKDANSIHFDELARPLNNADGNKVFFAGEATIQHIFSTVNGAYVTGIRAAEEIQREDKILDAPTTQTEYGMHPAFVVCGKKEHVLIQKSTDHKPFCVAKEIADTLLKRDIGNDQMWAIKAEEFPFSEWQESSHPK